ncbi:MAG TPA: hypothetical protein VJ917_12100 [Saprospiraceae bacterium]|nr:hypothetical protein [Saprospiraceae bacterium]
MKSYILTIAILSIFSCESWDLKTASFEEVVTGDVNFQDLPTQVVLSGEITGLVEDDLVQQHGHIWSLSDISNPDINNKLGQTTFGKIGNSSFESGLDGLAPGTEYNYRAYVVYEGNQPVYGEVKSFQTNDIAPVFEIRSITRESESTFEVDLECEFSNLPVGIKLSSFGYVWGAEPSPELENDRVLTETSIELTEDAFIHNKSFNLDPGLNYIRPFVNVNGKIYYGAQQTFSIANIWKNIGKLPYNDFQAVFSFSLNDHGYLLSFDGQLVSYDPEMGLWSEKAIAPERVSNGFTIGNHAYVLNYDGNLFKYSPVMDVWEEKSTFPMLTGAHGFATENKAYVLEENGNNFFEYDPAVDQWTQKQNFPGEARNRNVAFSIGDKGYIGLGEADFDEANDFWEYNIALDQWTRKADFPGLGRVHSVYFELEDRAFLGLGYFQTFTINPLSDFWFYDPIVDQWTEVPEFPGGERAFAFGFSVKNRAYVGGGYDSFIDYDDDIWEYTPDNK